MFCRREDLIPDPVQELPPRNNGTLPAAPSSALKFTAVRESPIAFARVISCACPQQIHIIPTIFSDTKLAQMRVLHTSASLATSCLPLLYYSTPRSGSLSRCHARGCSVDLRLQHNACASYLLQ